LGPSGMEELGRTILSKTYYAINQLNRVKGLKVPTMQAQHFKEFTVNFSQTRPKLKDLEPILLERGIHIGTPLTESLPELGETAVFCVTEVHSKEDIDKLRASLAEILEV